MMHARHGARLTLGTPATYRIRVQGRLDESWSERLGGLWITTSYQGDQAPVTTLVGTVKDQAELIGILNSLYDLHLPLLSVERRPCMSDVNWGPETEEEAEMMKHLDPEKTGRTRSLK